MKKTIISHFYNEEYLLPWWLEHHKKIFDHGIMINYHSTDESVNIIKRICPDWQIIDTRNECFDAVEVDKEIMDIELNLEGWRIVLNTTEFIVGNFKILESIEEGKGDITIPAIVMVDTPENEMKYLSNEESLFENRHQGLIPDTEKKFNIRFARRLGNYFYPYAPGRHFSNINTTAFIILWYGFSPFNRKLLNRKLQIQNKIPDSDKNKGYGAQHITDIEEQKSKLHELQKDSENVSKIINAYLKLSYEK
jgi:hypothetical protein